MPLAGLEPARCFHHLILSQARLPIPPQGHGAWIIAAGRVGSTHKCCLREVDTGAASGVRDEGAVSARASEGFGGVEIWSVVVSGLVPVP